ncbi:hypothetical protein [Paraconexibacter sp.]|uniref:hypothetical protein n=1 Tax=Paraconexibacter sp. TaxID=2949640 RepID=UPI0035673931
MSVLAVVLIAVAVLVLALFAGGLIGARRRATSTDAALRAQLEQVNGQLALAHAQDKGWDRETMETAARTAHAAVSSEPITRLDLVQIVDLPGTDADQAVFRIHCGDQITELTLGRQDGAWVAR